MTTTSAKIDEVVRCARRYGSSSIILLSGVPGTGKTHIALPAAQEIAGHAALVRQVQFHQAYTYEDFVEGLAPQPDGSFAPREGVFLEWNQQALRDPANTYVLLIEEISRANTAAVLGELMTFIEHRDRSFDVPVSRQSVRVAGRLVVLATMNPRDRSALEVDDALIRRLRIIDCPPDTDQLEEMLRLSLAGRGEAQGEQEIINILKKLFDDCRAQHPDTYASEMPFGHGMFAGVRDSGDLYDLWHQRIKHMLRRPLVLPHPFADTVEANYPWHELPASVSTPLR